MDRAFAKRQYCLDPIASLLLHCNIVPLDVDLAYCDSSSELSVNQFTISYSPLYLSYVLGFPIATAGFLTIAPLGAQLVIKLLTGLASDRLNCLPEVGKLRLFNSIALLGSGLFFILLSVVSPVGGAIDVILIVIPIALLGFSSGGYPKCAVMVSQQHSPFVMSIVQIVACCSLLTGSFVVPALTKDDTFEQWRNVFLIYAFVLTLSNTIFIAFARAEPAEWVTNPSKAQIMPADCITVTTSGLPQSDSSTPEGPRLQGAV
ncbi:hypothetical protein OSTOST_12963 [Ostertagia ostertagi]